MKLKGLIEEVFRGVTILRGYATLGTLAKLSIPQNYQRSQDVDRVNKIKEYMNSSSFVFFPELILGWQIEDNLLVRRIKEDRNFRNITTLNNIRFKKKTTEQDGVTSQELTIEIPENIDSAIFNRIDGNHRLGVLDEILNNADNSPLLDMVVPYSIIIQAKNVKDNFYGIRKEQTPAELRQACYR